MNKEIRNLFLLVLGVFILKIILLPFTQTNDADAVSRIFLSIQWMENPSWIKTDVWGPFHYYLNGIVLSIWEDRVIAPKMINIVLYSVYLIPFYYFTKREFDEKGAIYATVLLAFCPVLFGTSFLALSNTPFLFFLILSLNELSKGLQSNKIYSFLLSGIFLTIASGFRYEAWLIMALFGLLLFLYKKPKQAILFGVFAGIFPVIWMISNWTATGNPMHSINGNYTWTQEIMAVNENLHWKEHIKRIGFFPYSWVLILGPFVAFFILKYVIKTITKRDKKRFFWLVPFVVVFLFMVINSFKGNLLNHHRFTGTLVVFGLPFFSLFFMNFKKWKAYLTLGLIPITLLSTYIPTEYNKGAQPIPRISDNFTTKIQSFISENSEGKDYLIIDFLSWESTYYLALHSSFHPKKIYIQEGAKNSKLASEELLNTIKTNKEGLVVFKRNSELNKFINLHIEQIQTHIISEIDGIVIAQIIERKLLD